MAQRLGAADRRRIATADEAELDRIEASARAQIESLKQRIRNERAKRNQTKSASRRTRPLTLARGRQEQILTAVRDQRKRLAGATVEPRGASERVARQRAVQQFREETRRPAPRNLADEPVVRQRFEATDEQGNVFRGRTEPGLGVALAVREVPATETRAAVTGVTQVRPPVQRVPVSTPRVFSEQTGIEVDPSEVFADAPDFDVVPVGPRVVNADGVTGFRGTVGTTIEQGLAPPPGVLSAAPERRTFDFSSIEATGQTLSRVASGTFLLPADFRAEFAAGFTGESTFAEQRNPELSTFGTRLGTTARTITTLGFISNPLATSRAVTSTISASAPARTRFGVGIVSGVVQAETNRFITETNLRGIGASERTISTAGTVSAAVGLQITGEATGRLLASNLATRSSRFASLLQTSRGARTTLSLSASAPAGALEGGLEEFVSQTRTGQFDFTEVGRQSLGGASSTVLLGATRAAGDFLVDTSRPFTTRRALGRAARFSVFTADPSEPVGDIATTRLGVFGTENIAVRTPTPSLAFMGFSNVRADRFSASVTPVSSPSNEFIRVSDTFTGVNFGGVQTQSPATIGISTPATSIRSFTPSFARVRTRSPVRSFPNIFTQTRTRTPTNPFVETPILPGVDTPTFTGTPTRTTTPVFARVPTRTSVPVTTPVNIRTLTPDFGVPVFPFFPSASRTPRSSGSFFNFARPRRTGFAPGLASIFLNIRGPTPAPIGGFSGFEVRPLPGTPRRRRKSKKRRKKR